MPHWYIDTTSRKLHLTILPTCSFTFISKSPTPSPQAVGRHPQAPRETAVILGGSFVPTNGDLLAGCYGEGRPSDAWLSATYLHRDRWENKCSGTERKGEDLQRWKSWIKKQKNTGADDRIQHKSRCLFNFFFFFYMWWNVLALVGNTAIRGSVWDGERRRFSFTRQQVHDTFLE